MKECSACVGLDVHKDTSAVAAGLPGREEPAYRGEIKNQRKSLLRLIRTRTLRSGGEVSSFCHEAGPYGYGVYRETIETGHHRSAEPASLSPCRGLSRRFRFRPLAWWAALALLLGAGTVAAQDTQTQPTVRACFRARPAI